LDVLLAATPHGNSDVRAFVAAYYAFHPHCAIWDGLHAYDGTVPDFSRSAIQRRIADLERWGEQLRAYTGLVPTTGPLATQLERDFALIEHARALELFRWRDWCPHERAPTFYHGALDVSIYLKRQYAPAGERLAALTRHLSAIPEVMAAAQANLRLPLAGPAIHHAIHTYSALAEYYDRDLRMGALGLATHDQEKAAVRAALTRAIAAVRDFVAFLRDQLSDPPGEFRIGASMLSTMIQVGEHVDLPLDRIRSIALADLARNRERAAEVAARMGLTPVSAIASLGQVHLAEGEVLAAVSAITEALRAFMAASDVIDVSAVDDAVYHVIETPPFMRAGSAFMDTPGPFEQPGQPAYFYVTLPDPTWPSNVRESWLRKLNPWGLTNTAAHEAIPGHLVHFLHLARVPSAPARAFTSYASIEGWAHYAEQLLIETGYARDDPRAEFAQLTMATLRDCRLLIALDLHAGDTSLEQAADFIAANTHMAPIRCRQEAMRCAQDPGCLYYALGKLMLLKLRADYARQEGERYSLRRFHQAFLDCGAPPLPLARRMLLDDPAGDLF
jgi:uncharacterized protein (DUF885 family)